MAYFLSGAPTFQRQTLLDFQEAVAELGRTAAMMNVANTRAHRQTGEWRKNEYGDPLDEQARLSMARTSLLGARVADDEVRRLLDEMQHWWWGVPLAALADESGNAYKRVEQVCRSLNQQIGTVMRRLDAEDLANA